MTQTFTSNINETATKSNKDPKDQFANFSEPSKNVINNILNFSKNLEIKRSKFEKIKRVKIIIIINNKLRINKRE